MSRFFSTGSGGSVIPPLIDEAKFKIVGHESISTPADTESFAMALDQPESISGLSEAASLRFPQPGFGDLSTAPSDAKGMTLRFWLSGSAGTGVTNPTNADGSNNGSSATIQTAPAGSTSETLTSNVGSGIPAGTSFSTAIYRGWFSYTEALSTSNGAVILHSSTGLFSDITMLALTANTNHSAGDFTFDLVAAGVDTLAKLQSCQVLHRTTDAAAGVSPASMTVDAGCIELTGVL